MLKSYLKYIVIIFVIFLVDQISKIYVENNFNLYESVQVIKGFLNFTYAQNQGIAFSFGTDYPVLLRTLLFKFFPVLVCFFVLKLLIDAHKANHKLQTYAYTLILGGALGNIVDRIRLDYVVDFIAVYSNGWDLGFIQLPPWRFAIFNIADSAVSIAIAILILDQLLHLKQKKNAASH